jgi:hypothetical protein
MHRTQGASFQVQQLGFPLVYLFCFHELTRSLIFLVEVHQDVGPEEQIKDAGGLQLEFECEARGVV